MCIWKVRVQVNKVRSKSLLTLKSLYFLGQVDSHLWQQAHKGDEDIGAELVEDGLLMLNRKVGRKLAIMVQNKNYEDAMARAKKTCLNIW